MELCVKTKLLMLAIPELRDPKIYFVKSQKQSENKQFQANFGPCNAEKFWLQIFCNYFKLCANGSTSHFVSFVVSCVLHFGYLSIQGRWIFFIY